MASDLGVPVDSVLSCVNLMKELDRRHPGGMRRFLREQAVLEDRPLVVRREANEDFNLTLPHGNLDMSQLARALKRLNKNESKARRAAGQVVTSSSGSSGEVTRPTTPDPGVPGSSSQ